MKINLPIVKATGLSKIVANGDAALTILQEINLEVMPGEAVAVVGASGSGKSTLLGLLAGLDEPTSGRVELDGCDLFSLDEDGRAALRARLLGFVFQSFHLLPALDATENVMLPLELAGHMKAHESAAALLRRGGLRGRVRGYPKTLSGGGEQRVAFAPAVVTKPNFCLLMSRRATWTRQQARRLSICCSNSTRRTAPHWCSLRTTRCSRSAARGSSGLQPDASSNEHIVQSCAARIPGREGVNCSFAQDAGA
jgi:putative ABC transport system ATP-binding protein